MNSIEKFINDNDLYSTEGNRGIVNLCKLSRYLGYKDSMYFGQIEKDACYGDLIEFLSDNSGAIKAIVEFMIDFHGEEMEEESSDSMNDD